MKPTRDELIGRSKYHPPSPDGVKRHSHLSEIFIDLAEDVVATCPEGDELSHVLTRLEEAKFWASAAVARNPETR